MSMKQIYYPYCIILKQSLFPFDDAKVRRDRESSKYFQRIAFFFKQNTHTDMKKRGRWLRFTLYMRSVDD